MTPRPPALDIEADLTIEVDAGAEGRTTGRLTGSGQQLRLELDRPQAVTGSADRAAVRDLADALTAAGLRAEVHGPRGRLAVVDPARSSRFGALVFGNPHVAVERAAWPLALRAAAPGWLGVTAAVSTAIAVPLVVAALRTRRR